ncbi:DUF4175 domain-containing protein [Ruania zhangjianzhongii]|uniref:DUF4175 domain-containing protein n=1 Tax=Ruania zhangjianzhongii TaxID=2603206 RepID=UPI0011C713EB|nr:DUF4175 domain-containing protein [Ruania zhangjianzhongii]
MSQRFNAPPGWQVPEGFVPPTGWQPDPSWPPAPAGWNFWVDDAASTAAPASGGYGPAAPGGYGDAGGNGGGPSHAPGSANAALVESQIKGHKRSMLVGFGMLAATILVTVVTFAIAASSPTGGSYWFPWYLGLIGLIVGIRGAVSLSKAKKAQGEAAVGGMAGAYGPGPQQQQPAGPWQQGPGQQHAPGPQQATGQPPAAGQPQSGNERDDDGQRSLGDLYR